MAIAPIRLQSAWNFGGLSVRELVTRTWKKTQEHELMTRAAAVAFYALLATVPFLAILLTLAIQTLPDLSDSPRQDAGAMTQFEATVKDTLGTEAYGVIHNQIQHLQENPPAGLLSFGLLISIWLASSLFAAIIDAMNAVYGVEEGRPFWKMRLVAILMTLLQALILLGALVLIAAWPLILDWLGLGSQGVGAWLVTIVRWLLIWVMVLLSFALAFYIAPAAEQRWEWITPGSFIGSIVFLVATYGFGLYVRHFADYNKTYGSLAGIMILMFWFWLSVLILLLAGQMNKVIEHASPVGKPEGQKHEPADSANAETISEPVEQRSSQ